MKVLSVDQITRRESPLLYRTTYDALATLAGADEQSLQVPIEFVVESDPFGRKSVTVKLVEDVNEPSLPIIEELAAQIESLRTEGALP